MKLSYYYDRIPIVMIEDTEVQKYATLRNIKRAFVNHMKDLSDVVYDTTESISHVFSPRRTGKSKAEIQEYRKKIKVYDVFNFFNEFEILDIRLHILNEYVDHFVLVESRLTHSGKPKELLFEKNKHLFKEFEHKIIHCVVEKPLHNFADAKERLTDTALATFERTTIEYAIGSSGGRESFLRDSYEKEYVKKPLIEHSLADDDFCFISDLDEIWNPEAVIDYSRDDIFKVKQLPYVYYLNNRSNENWRGWSGTIGTKYKNIRNTSINHLRTLPRSKYTVVKNGGWHFTFQGGAETVMKKIEAYSHQEINNTDTKYRVKDTMSKNKDIMGRYFKFWIDEKDLPRYLLEHKDKYKNLFK
jgi:Glycosyltransferase family 17